VLTRKEFSDIETRQEFTWIIETVMAKGIVRDLSGGRTAYWHDGVVVILNPLAPDGGTAFKPRTGIDYFLNTLS
jgi:hypothetical protein